MAPKFEDHHYPSCTIPLPNSNEHRERINAFSEAFSARYRTRFDPTFKFIPTVDFVITRGVPAPKMNGNSSYNACLYFEDKATFPLVEWKLTDVRCRQIDIDVTYKSPVALYLAIEGGTIRWNLTGENIVAIYIRNSANYGMHKVTVNNKPYAQTRLGMDQNGCSNFVPLFPNRLGPAIAHHDQMLATLTGHQIDQLITNRGIFHQTSNGLGAVDIQDFHLV